MNDVREGVRPLHKVRLKNLKDIVKKQFKGNATACATAIGRSHTFLWQLLNDYRAIGEATARHIEEKLGLRARSLDEGGALDVDLKITAQLGNGRCRSYWMVPRVELGNLKTGKTTSGAERLPCPDTYSEATVFIKVTDTSLEPVFRRGQNVFCDPKERKLHAGHFYFVHLKKRGSHGIVRQALKTDGGEMRLLALDPRLKDEVLRPSEVCVFGRVVMVSEDWPLDGARP